MFPPLQKLEEQLDEAQTGCKVLESEKLGLDQKVCDLQMQLEEVRRERKTLVSNASKASSDLKAKNLELGKLKEVTALPYTYQAGFFIWEGRLLWDYV